MMWHVYIILCADGTLYTGISNDPEKRFFDHQRGTGARYTKSHRPIKILYREQLLNHSEALRRESEIKGWSREKKIRILKLEL